MSHQPGVERNGAVVEIGDEVRLLAIRPSILKRLVGEENSDVSAMQGQVVKVFDVYEDGQVWVSAFFPRKDGTTEVHAIAVEAEAIELVQKATRG
jgi:hypothetical protein